ncbi:hypothetical protein C8Q76DRAFT_693197 [Earliella scabrosa]|nr:hypothetical protein C8Q76DRAFT_693197 [Earliella scabrosa]
MSISSFQAAFRYAGSSPPFIRLSYNRVLAPNVIALITDYMDMPTLLQWKGACRGSQEHAIKALQKSLHHLLRRFLPATRELLRIVTECRAMLSGIFALAFLLRDVNVETESLDIYINDVHFQNFLEYLLYSPFVSRHLQFHGMAELLRPHRQQRAVRRFALFTTTTGRRLRLHESTTLTACSPISRSWTSALINFVTETSFGCAYPQLTFHKRAIFADMWLTGMTVEERRILTHLHDLGFTVVFHPGQWDDHGEQSTSPRYNNTALFPCFRHLYNCPDQGRYFGDPGSLVAFIDPVLHGPAVALQRSTPPFGTMAAWRLWVSGSCEEGCAYNDAVLPGYTLSLPMAMLLEHSFGQAFQIPPACSGPGLVTLPPALRRRGRSASI